MVIVYSLCVLISASMFLLLYLADTKGSVAQNTMLLFMTISNLGYLALSLSTSLAEAMLAIKISYVGGCFLPFLYFLTLCEVCHFRIPKWISFICLLFQVVIYCFVCTLDYHDYYYKSIRFASDAVNNVVKEYGPMHSVWVITVYGYFLCSFITALFSVGKKKSVNHRELRNMIICSGLAVLCYGIQRIIKFDFEITPISYLILIIGAISPIYHSNLYTVTENKSIVNEQINKIGFITFNNSLQFMNCNDFARNIFPELQDCLIGHEMCGCSDILNVLVRDVKEFSSNNKKSGEIGNIHEKNNYFCIDNKHYTTEINTINSFTGRCKGYTVEIKDETEHYRIIELTTKYNEQLSKEVEQKTKKILTIQEKTILGMAQMVESRDLSTGGHIKRTSDVVRIFAKKLMESNKDLDSHFLSLVIRSAPMHDLGKIGVDDAVLRKQGKFTDEEYENMKRHSEIGAKMVNDILTDVEDESFVTIARNVAHYHHEKYNGKGYPEGLSGEQIPIEARIMALADVFDALVSKRCYKEAFSYEKAWDIIKNDTGSHFDPNLAPIFMSCKEELEDYYNNCDK